MRLQSKTAIITGASSGIGAAAAKLFAREGANLVLGARRKERLDALIDELQDHAGEAIALPGDVKDEVYANQLVDLAVSRFGQLDIAFNNAGILGDAGPVPQTNTENWHNVIHTNLSSAFYAAKYQIPKLVSSGNGSLIFTSSFVGHTIGLPGMAVYGASKAGLIGLTQCLAAEHGPQGLRVNALLPGGTLTEMAGDNAEAHTQIASMHSLKRMATPEEVANAALFLASDEASFVTGSAMLVDGGNSITKV